MAPVLTRAASRKGHDKSKSANNPNQTRPPSPVSKSFPDTSDSDKSPAGPSNLTFNAKDSEGLAVANNPKEDLVPDVISDGSSVAGPSNLTSHQGQTVVVSKMNESRSHGRYSCFLRLTRVNITTTTGNNLLTLPLVVQGMLLEYLSIKDELALRRVCKTTRNWVSKQSTSRRALSNWEVFRPKIDSSTPYGLKYAVSMKVPFSFFEIEINQTHPRELVNSFLSIYGRTLRSLYFTRSESTEKIDVSIRGCGNSCACTRRNQCFKCKEYVSILDVLMVDSIRFPTALQNLQEMKMEITLNSDEEIEVFHRLLEKCVSLKKLTLPFTSMDERANSWATPPELAEASIEIGKLFWHPLTEEIQRRGLPNLKVIDMTCWNHSYLGVMNTPKMCTEMMLFLTEVAALGARFLNLPGHIIEKYAFSRPDWEFMVTHDNEAIYNKIDSLIYPGPRILSYLSFPNLKEITVGNGVTVACTSLYIVPEALIKWPHLETINIRILNQNNVEMNGCIKNVETRLLVWERTVRIIEGFRGTIPRSNVRKITVYEELPQPLEVQSRCSSASNTVMFSPVSITYTFHRIRVLEISRWDSITDEGFLRLWGSLVLLESLKINNCPNLTDNGFGVNQPSPEFTRLRNLKELEICVDSPCNLTDGSLKNVFSRMRLTAFTLKGSMNTDGYTCRNGWITKITEEGIFALLNGNLGSSVKRMHVDVDCPPWLTRRRCGELSKFFPSFV